MRTALLVLAILFCPAPASTQPPPGAPRTINIFALKNADAEKHRPIVTTIFGADPRTNSLIVAADADTLKGVNEFVTELDKPAKPKK